LLFHEQDFSKAPRLMNIVYLYPQISKTKQDMEVISIERSTYEELLTSFNRFVAQMRALADRGTDKRLGEWLDNQDVCQMLNISPRTLQTLRDNGTLGFSQVSRKCYYKPEDVERILHVVADRDKDCKMCNFKMGVYE
jgi:hypothetical protein